MKTQTALSGPDEDVATSNSIQSFSLYFEGTVLKYSLVDWRLSSQPSRKGVSKLSGFGPAAFSVAESLLWELTALENFSPEISTAYKSSSS